MNELFSAAGQWLIRTLAVGGALLLLAAVAISLVRQPIRRRTIGSWAVRVSLLIPLLTLAPSWLNINVPEPAIERAPKAVAETQQVGQPAPSNASPVTRPAPATTTSEAPLRSNECYIFFVPTPAASAANTNVAKLSPTVQPPPPTPAAVPTPTPTPTPDVETQTVVQVSPLRIVGSAYLLVAAFFLGRWLIGHIALWGLLRSSRPAASSLTRILEGLVGHWRTRPELRIAKNLKSPVCCGIRRQVILLPQRIAETGDEQSLRLVFAHELAHLERGDSWTGCWFGLAQVLYFPLPWFWWLRRQVRLCQEYVADAAAAGLCRAEDYAAFLVDLSRSARPVRKSAALAGVIGNSSDLFRRVTMLLNANRRVDGVCSRPWSLLTAGAFLGLAILLSGVGLSRVTLAEAGPRDDTKDAPKADEPKKGGDDIPLKQRKPGAVDNPEELDKMMQKLMDEMQKRFQQQDAQLKKMIEEMQKRIQQGGFGGLGGAGGVGGFMPGGLGGNNNFGRGGAMVFPNGGLFAPNHSGSGRLGAMIEKPQAALVEQLDLPKDQGLVLAEIKADSAAAKAGLKANDILLEINGKAVSSNPQEFRKQLSGIKANTAVDAVVLRKGKRETVKGLTLPEAKPEDESPFGGLGGFGPRIQLGPNGIQIDELPIPPIPPQAIPIPVPVPGAAGANKTMSISVSNDRFTINSHDDGLSISLTGKLEEGKAVLESATIVDGNKKVTADNLDKVPEKYRSEVKSLLGNIKGGK